MNLMEITKGYEPKQNEQTEQMKNLPDTTDKWKQLAKEQAASLEKVTAERDELQVKYQKAGLLMFGDGLAIRDEFDNIFMDYRNESQITADI